MDTPISPGNSGGPLVDLWGNVVGINTLAISARAGAQGLNFAIPIDTAKPVIAAILKTATADKKGHVERADLGIDLKPLQDLETFYALDINKGALINSVDRNSPAMKAGVRTQDILLAINDKPINVRFPEEVAPARKLISQLPISQDVVLSIKRGHDTLTLIAKPQKLESAVGDERELKPWGLSVRDVTTKYANEQQLDDDQGVVVTTLTPGYPAAKGGLESADVLRTLNNHPIPDLDAFMLLYNDSIKAHETRVMIEFERNRALRHAVLKLTPPATRE